METSDREKEGRSDFQSPLQVFQNPTGEKNLRVRGDGGKWVTFYSQRDIAREIQNFGENLSIPEDAIVVLLGLGLGYHLSEIARRIQVPIFVVEKDPEIFRLAMEMDGMAELARNPRIAFIVGENPEETLQILSAGQIRLGLKDFSVIPHPPSLRSFPIFYRPIEERLKKAQKARIGKRFQYEKFKGEKLRILLINSQYLMMGELVRAIERLGHSLKTIIMEREAEVGQREFIAGLLRLLWEFQPDFILTVNHLGFDREGVMTDFLTSLKIPFASWYVDSPMLIIKHYQRNLSPYCAIFLWDEDYIADMKALGFSKVHFLPLGSDPRFFRPIPPEGNPLRREENDVSFVGNSMIHPVRKKMERLGLTEEDKPFIEELGRAYAWSACRNVSEILDRPPYSQIPLIQSMKDGKRVDFEALVMCQGTLFYRLEHIRKLEPFHPVIRGDDGWNRLLNGSFQIGPELLYYYNLNSFYNVSKINFNVTSTQMRNAVNQRVFDVPATGRFLLTDYKKQLEGLFEIGREMICYRDPDEIKDLVRFYLKHEREREKIAALGYRRLLAQHTYEHRVSRLCEIMRREFK